MAFDPFLSSLSPASPLERTQRTQAPASVAGAGSESFENHLEKAIDAVEQGNQEANVQAEKAAMGEGNLHELALSMEKSDIQMRILLKTRNKLIEAYQEIMRMPV